MAHFGVKKAKNALAIAGFTAAVGAGLLLPVGSASAASFSDLTRGTDYDCDNTKVDYFYGVHLLSANAIDVAVTNPESFFNNPTGTNCYVDFGSVHRSSNDVEFIIDSGDYAFEDSISEGERFDYRFRIADGSTVSFAGNGGIRSYRETGRYYFRPLYVGEGATFNINGGSYGLSITNEGGTIDFDSTNLSSSYILNRTGTMDFTNVTFKSPNTSTGGIIANNGGTLTIHSGEYSGYSSEYSINLDVALIQNSGTLNIEGGNFRHNPEHSSIGFYNDDGEWRPYYDEPHGMIENSGTLNISDGTFRAKGAVIGNGTENAETHISGGTFISDYFYAAFKASGQSTSTTSTLEITGGTIVTRDSFNLTDAENVGTDQSAGVWRDGDGNVRGNFCTGPYCSSPYVVVGFEDGAEELKGGIYSDGENVTPAPGYDKIELDQDSDGDGKNDVIILPVEEGDPISVELREQTTVSVPSGSEIVSIENDDYCSAEINGNEMTVTGLKVTDASTTCKIRISDSSSFIRDYEVSVEEPDYNITDGKPLSISEGETKTPSDLGDGRTPEDFEEWGILEGDEYCTVNEKGEITAIKGGGTCEVYAYDEDTGDVIIWLVNTTSPLELEVGESKQPDLPDGVDPAAGTWSSDNEDVCTVSEDGTITAKKAGTCHVTFDLGEDGIYTWTVTVKENPNTLDKSQAISFSIAGAVIAGFGAAIATIKRFNRR